MRFWYITDGVLASEIRDMDMDRPAAAFALIRDQLGLPRLVTLSEPRCPGNCSTCVTASVLNGKPVVVSGHEDGAIYAWDLESREPIWNNDALLGQRGLGAYVDSIAVCEFHGRPVIVAGGSPGMIGAWDLADGSVVVEPFLSHEHHAVRGIAITELYGRAVMIAAGLDRRVRAWDSHEHILLDEREIDTGFPFTPLAVGSPGGQVIIVSGTGDGFVGVWRPSGTAARDREL